MKAPLDVKRAIWEHEKDELIYDKRMGSAHLTDQRMAEATAEANLFPGVRAALMAWMYLSTTRPWIEALTVNHITERKNNPAIVKGGGFTARFAHKRVADQGGTIEKLDINTKVHMVADEDHSDMFEPIDHRHITDERISAGSDSVGARQPRRRSRLSQCVSHGWDGSDRGIGGGVGAQRAWLRVLSYGFRVDRCGYRAMKRVPTLCVKCELVGARAF